jgi:hypothetical protein
VALLLPPLAGGQFRRPALDLASQRQRGPANLVEVQRRSMRMLTWMPREPDVLGQPTSPLSASTSARHQRHATHVIPLDAGHRVEVDAQLVRVVQVLGADRDAG